MGQIFNVLVYCGRSSQTVCQTLAACSNCLTIPANTFALARHAMDALDIDIFVCTTRPEGGEVGPLLREASDRFPNLRTILTGPTETRAKAERLQNIGLAHRFVYADAANESLPGSVQRLCAQIEKFAPPEHARRVNALGKDKQRYKLQMLIAEGGAGKVYRAHDHLLDMPVAVKMLPEKLEQHDSVANTLRHEARIVMQLSHRHIIKLFNLIRLEGRFALVMEYIPGETLHDVQQRTGPFNLESVARIIHVCGEALAYAHKHGVLHNDLKPANLILAHDGVLKIIDFGISQVITPQSEPEQFITGTPAYMSPEQQKGESLDQRTDVYALGIIAYELLTGKVPFPKDLPDHELLGKARHPLDGLRGPVRDVLETATAYNRNERWPDIASFANAFIDSCENSEGDPRTSEKKTAQPDPALKATLKVTDSFSDEVEDLTQQAPIAPEPPPPEPTLTNEPSEDDDGLLDKPDRETESTKRTLPRRSRKRYVIKRSQLKKTINKKQKSTADIQTPQ